MEIKEFTNKEVFSAEDILNIISLVGKNKDIIMVKNDGIRDTNQYTVVIISSVDPEKSFRCDDSSLQNAMKTVLQKYLDGTAIHGGTM
jgi:hypothetical protein